MKNMQEVTRTVGTMSKRWTENPMSTQTEEIRGRNTPFESLSRAKLEQAMHDRLQHRARFLALESRSAVLDRCNRNIELVTKWFKQVGNFPGAIVDANIDIRMKASGAAANAARKPIRDAALALASSLCPEIEQPQLEIKRSPKTLKLLTQPKPILRRELNAYVSEAIDALAEKTWRQLVAFHTSGFTGQAEFGSAGGHCYAEMIHPSICAEEKSRVVHKRLRRREEVGAKRQRTTTKEHVSSRMQYQWVTRIELLSDVLTVPLRDCHSRLPSKVATLCKQMPSFLLDFATVTSGTQQKATIIRQDIAENTLSYKTEVVEETVVHNDPFLAIGPCVIAWWCPKS